MHPRQNSIASGGSRRAMAASRGLHLPSPTCRRKRDEVTARSTITAIRGYSRLMEAPTAPPAEALNAVAYRRAHVGKLMVVERKKGQEPLTARLFRVDAVETHPTGLVVTGIFNDARRGHMMASAVREASEAEIAWRNSKENEPGLITGLQ